MSMPTMPQRRSFLAPYLENMPRGVFTSWMGGQDKDLQSYYGDRFNDFYNEYQAELARLTEGAMSDQFAPLVPPQLGFLPFLKSINLRNRYNDLTSRQKGFYHPAAAPRTRFLSY